MDRKAILAIVLCIAFLILYRPLLHWLGVDRYLEPPSRHPATAVDTTKRDTTSAAGPITAAPTPGTAARAETGSSTPEAALSAPPTVPGLERSVVIETPLYRATFSTRGARLLAVEIKRYASAHGVSSVGGKPKHWPRGEVVPPGDRVVLAGGPLFGLDLGSNDALKPFDNVTYAVAESLDAAGEARALTFTAEDPSGLHVRQTYRVRPDAYALDLEVELKGIPVAWRVSDYSLTMRSWPLLTEADLLADARALRATSMVGTNLHREHAGGLVRGPKSFDGSAAWASVQSRYLIAAVAVTQGPSRGVISSAYRRPLTPEELKVLPAGTRAEQEVVTNSLVVGLLSESNSTHRFVLYAGPCEYFRLAALKLQLELAVDLGWTWVLPFSKALLQLLNWLYAVLRNYGLTILVLATLVRLILHPLNMMSMKSMRAMQRLQPELERIREKYKSEPQAMNSAIMALYKENKVNPAGGCLPMLIQMPLFIGLYQVLFNAIELRQAPFVAWIYDLSAPDLLFSVASFPVRLLPLLMLGSGFLAQLVTPTDPRQLPTMYMMNVIMLVFFYNLPSGLVLYWTIMNVLTALQQWMVLRHDRAAAAVAAAPVAAAPARAKRRQATGR
jgi:YidC/Oxa1 family membrane protein insertase